MLDLGRSRMARVGNKSAPQRRRSSSLKSKPGNLREVLRQNPECEGKFNEAEKLARSLHDEQKYTPLPFFTRHGIDHCKKLEEFSNNIIWRSEHFVDHEFEPSPEEAMYLLSAIWLHDIGMMYTIFDGENSEDLKNEDYSNKIRDEHEQRTVRYIHKIWKEECTWSPNQKVLLGNICYFHRKRYPIAEFDPVAEKSSYEEYNDIRLAVLASLLRLVDGCHADQSRAPLALLGLYRSVGMSVSHALHWERAQLITSIEFDHENREIIIVANCPKPYKFFGGIFDLRKVVTIIQKDVVKELESVQSVLLPWSNLFFLNVTIQIRVVKSLEYLYKDQYFALWPYLLQDPRSSTEASAAFIQIVLFTLDLKEISWIEEIKAMSVEIKKLRSLDFMLINLCASIEAIIHQIDTSPDEIKINLRNHLKSFLASMEKNCDDIIPHALELIVPESILFVFGYSINIEKILREVSTKIKVIIVDCFEPIANGFLDTENTKMLNIIKDSGVDQKDIQFIQFYSFPHVLSNMAHHENKTLLLGTHGVLDSKDLLCKVGSELLARCAVDYNVQVVAFAEKSKFLSPDINEEERETINNSVTLEENKWHPKLAIYCVEPKMDVVPKKLIDILITEEGNISSEVNSERH